MDKMIYRKLGSTDINVSTIGIGTHQFGGDWDLSFKQKNATSILQEANERGINLIDTAACYGPDHLSERLIGTAISKNREEWILATKFGQRYDNNTKKEISDFSPSHVKSQLEKSLSSLKVDKIDLYQFHSGSNTEFENEDLWSFLHKQIDKDKIGSIGVSFAHGLVAEHDTFQLKELREKGADFVQLVYNRLNKVAEEEYLPFCLKNNIGVLARVPLAKGFLSGKYLPGHKFTSLDHRSKFSNEMNDSFLERVIRIKREEVPSNVNMSQWALSWCLKNQAVSSVIPGAKNVKQVQSNAGAITNI